MYIDNHAVEDYGVRLWEYKIAGTPLTVHTNKSRSDLTFAFLGSELGLKNISLSFDLWAGSRREAALKKSQLDALAAAGRVELYLPDGFYYTAVLKDAGTIENIYGGLVTCGYEFEGVQHEALKTLTLEGGAPFQVYGTAPRMNCMISTHVRQAAEKYPLAGITFENVEAGEMLQLDGLTKRVLVNGVPAMKRCDLVEFPHLTPGSNRIPCPDPVTVAYYPTYL